MPHKDIETRKAYAKAYRETHKAYYQKKFKEWAIENREYRNAQRREKLKSYMAAYMRKYRQKDKLKATARDKVRKAIQQGKLLKETCFVCKNTITEAHHKDYNKPLEVVWYCKKHHSEQHKKAKSYK